MERWFWLCAPLLVACGRLSFDAAGGDAGRVGDGSLDAPPRPWPNEPPGFTVLTDQPWDSLASLGWLHNACASTIVSDASAPFSPSNVLEHPFPIGAPGDAASCIDYYPLSGLNEMYLGFWWKPSNPWQGAGDGNNAIATLAPPLGAFDVMMVGTAEPFVLEILAGTTALNDHIVGISNRVLPTNVGDGTVVLGAWHQIEVRLRRSTTSVSQDGIVQWWLDGTPVGSHANVNFDEMTFIEVSMKSYWGTGPAKAENDFYRYDHARVSAP